VTLQSPHDVLLQEHRRAELARRLISHGVRTKIITRLTDLTRNRLSTVRRRLGVADEERSRGPTRYSLKRMLKNPRTQAEGAVLVTLCSIFEIPIQPNRPALPEFVSLNFGERLCEAYEAFREISPETALELEHLILIRRGLSVNPDNAQVQLANCRACKCLVLRERSGRRECWHCAPTPSRKARGSRPRTRRGRTRTPTKS